MIRRIKNQRDGRAGTPRLKSAETGSRPLTLFSLLWGPFETLYMKAFSKSINIESKIKNSSYKGCYLENWGNFTVIVY